MSAQLRNHVSSCFIYKCHVSHSTLDIAELLEKLRARHRHHVVSNHTTCPSLSKSWTVHLSVRSLALFPDRARWYDSRGGSRGAHRTMSITVRDFSSGSYCSSLLPLRDFSALEQGRSLIEDRTARAKARRKRKHTPDVPEHLWPLPCREP